MTTPTIGHAVPARRWLPSRLYYGWVLVLVLGITETVSWGILYYAFSVCLSGNRLDHDVGPVQ
ncbi:MAG: hypothetical protein HY332_22055 [Chloroflexi bacterium]|nr:hypothetical protein [Chloroflexota bacterium]